MHHPQLVQSPNINDCLKVKIDVHAESQLLTKLLLRVSVRELHNRLVSNAENGGLKESIDAENNIIIRYSTIRYVHYCHPNFFFNVDIKLYVWL